MEATKEFILKVNEVYHDIEGEGYEKKHPEIFIDEVKRWENIGKEILSKIEQKIVLLDLGTGTGFVPMQIARYLKKDDLIICSDLSAQILDACRNNFQNKDYSCKFEFIKLDGDTITLGQNSVDCITVNSVLHHIPDFESLFREIDRILKPGGYLMIGHEPNKLFYNHKFLWSNSLFINYILNPRLLLIRILKLTGLYSLLKTLYLKKFPARAWTNPVYKKLNQRLLEEMVINKPMNELELAEIVDFHSPTAGEFRHNIGIDIKDLKARYLANYEIVIKETYNYIDRVYSRNSLMRRYDSKLKKIYPEYGSQIFVVFKKTNIMTGC